MVDMGLDPAIPADVTRAVLTVQFLRGGASTFGSRDEILNRLRGRDADLFTRAVDILISRLRRKLEPLPVIKTLRNAGYTFAGVPRS
jgi:DNA-binding response OmpR family regulator